MATFLWLSTLSGLSYMTIGAVFGELVWRYRREDVPDEMPHHVVIAVGSIYWPVAVWSLVRSSRG